ncbi:MAG: type I restriction endonuclease, partial [Pseudanabaena sp. LacPavin_0818_WC45_MAG_42_6]|nr:type I restriction endonuclease [Pseudanabaena sp. LacPavin_0818_WC45_MAG_42_6]
QVTNQITQQGKYKNRYDVTLLINGLPLVQIELKRRGLDLKEAFNQINRYQRHSYGADFGLFQYVQIFVISNGVNTRYYANNRKQEYKQTFYWADVENNLITQLDDFASAFLEKCHLSKMICKYIVLHQSDKVLMVLRASKPPTKTATSGTPQAQAKPLPASKQPKSSLHSLKFIKCCS